jgi:hypothetical protein
MLTVEELYLLLTRENGDPEAYGLLAGFGLTAAALTDLVVAERIAVTPGEPPHVHVLSTASTGSHILDGALALMPQRDGRTVESAIRWGRLDPQHAVTSSLARAGVLGIRSRRMLGLGRPRTPILLPEEKQRVRARLAAVLAGEQPPSPADATILAVLRGLAVDASLLHDLVDVPSYTALERRIAVVVASCPPPGGAIANAIQQERMSLARSSGLLVANAVPNRGIGAGDPEPDD